jgi:CHAT domain-containing protein
VKRLAADKATACAEAMHQSMLDPIDHGKSYEAQPAFWAPFVVVGEGGAGR